MTTIRKLISLLLTSSLLLCGCGAGKKNPSPTPATPVETAECVMESIRDLDMDTLNAYTDNYVQTWHNWIGFPIEREYRAFNELLQPASRNSRRYKTSRKLDQRMMEELNWEITEVRESDGTAEIDLAITNIDMLQVMDRYEAQLLENILETPGTGIIQLVRDTAAVKDTLISLIDELDDSDTVTTSVTISAYQEEGHWKIHMSPDFINAFSGNMYAVADSEEITRLEELIDAKADEWAEDFEDKAGQWAENFEKKVDQW